MSQYRPMRFYFSPASIPQIVAHIEDYLYRNPIVSTETIAEIIVQALSEHPELLNGSVIPITEDSEQSIKAYIDSLTVDTYTKAQIDTLLSGKQNTLQFDNTPTAESTNPVTSDGINYALVTLEAAINAVLVTKANAANVYTKAQTDTLLLEKADVSNVYSKNTVDAMFETVPTLDDVYDKSDIDYMRQIDKANTAIVTTDGIAPTNISAGQYVYVGDVLYMATQAITQGDTVVPGTNAELNPLGVTNRIGDGLQNVAGAVSSLSQQIDNLDNELSQQSQQIDDLQQGIAIIVDGDTASVEVPVGGYAYIKNNTHGLAEGMYKNTSSSTFPVSSGTANSTVFTAVQTGAVNDAVSVLNSNSMSESFVVSLSGVSADHFVFKTGKICRMHFALGDGTAFNGATGYDTVGNIPQGYRPNFTAATEIIIGRTSGTWAMATYFPIVIRIETNGNLIITGNANEVKQCKYVVGELLWTTN